MPAPRAGARRAAAGGRRPPGGRRAEAPCSTRPRFRSAPAKPDTLQPYGAHVARFYVNYRHEKGSCQEAGTPPLHAARGQGLDSAPAEPKHRHCEGHRERSDVLFPNRRRLLGAQRAPLRTARGPDSHDALAETDHVVLTDSERAEPPIMSGAESVTACGSAIVMGHNSGATTNISRARVVWSHQAIQVAVQVCSAVNCYLPSKQKQDMSTCDAPL